MRNTHEPREEFVERLEGSLRAEVRRRNRLVERSRWTRWMIESPMKAAAAAVVVVLVSMGIGGMVVAAAYEGQTYLQRNSLKEQYAQRLFLAQQRLVIVGQQLKATERQASVGVETQDALLEARFKVAEAETQLQILNLELAEVDITGREPQTTISSPLVSGRDFVTERLKIEMRIPMSALQLEQQRVQSLDRRVAVGAASRVDAETSRARIVELEAALSAFQKRLNIRERFLAKQIDAGLADLYVLESEAEQRRTTLAPRLNLAQKILKDTMSKVEVGTAEQVELALAQLKVKELELDMTRADVDLAAIRRQIDQRRSGR